MLKTVGNLSIRNGDQTILNGNLVIGTAGKGIDFSAASHASGMTSELLDDYEEGTWTFELIDAATGGNLSSTTTTGYYTKIGNVVNCYIATTGAINTAGMTSGNTMFFTLPFNPINLVGYTSGTMLPNTLSYRTVGATEAHPVVSANITRGAFQTSGPALTAVNCRVSEFTTGVTSLTRIAFSYLAD
jgi:hypothetical protein